MVDQPQRLAPIIAGRLYVRADIGKNCSPNWILPAMNASLDSATGADGARVDRQYTDEPAAGNPPYQYTDETFGPMIGPWMDRNPPLAILTRKTARRWKALRGASTASRCTKRRATCCAGRSSAPVDLFVQAVGEQGLRPPQFALLLAAYQNPQANQSELVRLTGIDRSTAADMITRLAGRGLIRRVRTEADGRANRLSVTAMGVAALEAAADRVERAQENIVGPIPAGQRAQFLKNLSRIADLPDLPEPPAGARRANPPAIESAKDPANARIREGG